MLLVLPLHHVHGLINVLGCALWSGACCDMLPRFDAELTWERLAAGDLTVFMAVPTIYHRLIASWQSAAPATCSWRARPVRVTSPHGVGLGRACPCRRSSAGATSPATHCSSATA